MIINIPLQIDEATIEGKLQVDYEKRVISEIEKRIQDALTDRWGYSGEKDAMKSLINSRVDIYIDNHKEEILEIAALKIYNRAIRTKKIKEVKEQI